MTKQARIPSNYTSANTAFDVIKGIDLTGKIAIVTGGYVGLGLETTKALISAGAKVIVPARSLSKAQSSLAGLEVQIEPMDLLDPASIDKFAASFNATNRPLHILINNAGIVATSLIRDSRGIESQMATNHFGHFQLTARLWPALKRAGSSRVVCVSSLVHFNSVIFDDWNYKDREYNHSLGYGQSKTANILFAYQLDKIGAKFGVRAFSLHPGVIVNTELNRNQTDVEALTQRFKSLGFIDSNGKPVIDPSKGWKTPEMGASTQVWCATSPLLEGKGGIYCENNDISPLASDVKATSNWGADNDGFRGVKDYAIDVTNAEKLWKLSVEITGIDFE